MRTSFLSICLKHSIALLALIALSVPVTAQENSAVEPAASEVVEATAPATVQLTSGENEATANADQNNATESVEPVRRDPDEARANRRRERTLNSIHKTQVPVEGFESVEMFSAMDSGDVEVVIKTKSATEANIIVTNTSNRPLAIRMPPAFGTTPILRQGIGGGGGGNFGGGGGNFGGGGGNFGGGGGQQGGGGFGGGNGGGNFGGGGGGNFGGGGGGGIFNIPPGRVGRVGVNTVCLEQGRPDPALRMDYAVVPLEEVATDPKIFELCRMLATDEADHGAIQAAAWNITDELSWDALVTMNRIERMDGSFERFFHPQQVLIAQQIIAAVDQRATLRAQQTETVVDTGELFNEQSDR